MRNGTGDTASAHYSQGPLRRLPVAFVLVIGLTLSIVAFLGIQMRERQVVQQEFTKASDIMFADVRKSMDRALLLTEALDGLFTVSDSVSREDFRTFVLGTGKYLEGIQALQWLPRVSRQERPIYQARAWAEGLTGYTITDLNAKGKIVPAQERDEYFPIYYVQPQAGNEAVIGFDAENRPTPGDPRKAARDTGELRASGRFTLLQETGRQFGIILVKPVYKRFTAKNTVQERRDSLRGYIQLVLRGGDFLEASVSNTEARGLTLYMHDMSAPEEERFLHAVRADGIPYETAMKGLHAEYDLDIGGRVWRITCMARPEFLARFSTHYAYVTGGGGLLLTAMLCAYLLNILGQNRRTATLVSQRTAELQQSRERFDLALRGGDLGLWDWNTGTGEVIVNRRWAEIIEYEHEDIEPRFDSWLRLVHPEDLKKAQVLLEAHLSGKVPIYEAEFRMAARTGGWKWILARGSVMERDAEGHALRVVGTHLDITDRKAAQQEFEKLKERLEMALEASASGLWDWDVTTGQVILDDQWAAIHGYSKHELPQRVDTWERSLHPDDAPEVTRRLEQCLKPDFQGLFEAEYRAARKTGEWIWILTRGRVMQRDEKGAPLRMVGTIVDITGRKLLEDELRQAKDDADKANQAKSDFLANMSHEIRTPMNAVIGLTDLTLGTDLTPRQLDYLKKIRQSSRTLLGVINDILDFSKIEAGKLDLEHTGFNLREITERIDDIFTDRMKEKGLDFTITIDPALPPVLAGDPLRLEQVLVNLVGNALKFTEKGSVALHIEDASNPPLCENHAASILFRIQDTGIGIAQEDQAKLFQSFSQADTSTTRKYGGSGLGLAICRRLVEMMGGSIRLDSAPGQGSTFSFVLSMPCLPEDMMPGLDGLHYKGMRALVVDDHDTMRDILCAMLAGFGFETAQAEDAESALALLRGGGPEARFELMLLDLKMPGMDGVSLARAIREMAPSLPVAPKLILTTAYGLDEALHTGSSSPLDSVLLKPVQQSTLLNTISAVLPGAPQIEHDAPANTLPSLHGKRILLVEDNPINQQVAAEMLRVAGIDVDVAAQGAQALEMVLRDPSYDAILMDVQMPVMDGYTATRKIRESSLPDTLPIIAMTAHAMTGDRQKCIDAGMNDYIAKPVDTKELYRVLHRWLGPGQAAPSHAPRTKVHELPKELPGIDLAIALERLGGNTSLLHRLLADFAASYADAKQEIAAHLTDSQTEDARRIAHTIKGVAGNLGATQVHLAATALDADLRAGKPHEQSLAALGKALDMTMPSLIALGTPGEPPLPDEAPGEPTPASASPRKLLAELRRLVDDNNFQAAGQAAQLLTALRGTALEDSAKAVEDSLTRFDFAGAGKALGDLEASPLIPPTEDGQ